MLEKQKRERDGWQQLIRNIKEKQRVELNQLKKDLGSQNMAKVDRMRQLSQFGERVMRELGALQEHLQEVRQETIDKVVLADDEEFEESLLGRAPKEASGGLPQNTPPSSAPAVPEAGQDPRRGRGSPLPALVPQPDGGRAASGGFFITQNF